MNNQQIVDALVVRSTEELFAAYQVKVAEQVEPAEVPGDDILFAGVIGFTGKNMRGTLVLAPTRTMLERSHQGENCEFRDWAGELANQLLGRIKNQLRRYGIDIEVTTPVIVKGQYLASVPRIDRKALHSFAASPGNVSVWFDAELAPGVVLVLREVPSGPREGEAVLF